jgi:cellulose synthase/poly-beta-1,6-N-acetylglucosamine synthase-like glycosyltransferase
MLIGFVILFALVAGWYLLLAVAPAQRALPHCIYCADTSPAALNGGYPGDDVTTPAPVDPPEWPSVVVIVPGRNEGHLLTRTLGSLCAMEYPRFRVVFVDDQSTDDTAAVCRVLGARFPHLTVIHNTESPRDGWVGKPWAVHQAEPHMNESDYLLFTDSDLEFHPQCLKQAVRLALHRRADLTSMLPSIEYETVGELLGLLAAMTIINSKLSLYVCNNPKKPLALVAGGFLLVKRRVYHELGGHASVRGQVIEDIALGARAKKLGMRVFTALTHDLYCARMYEGWRDTFRGLKKNAYAGANYNLPFALLIFFFLVLFGAMVPVWTVLGLWLALQSPSALTVTLAALGLAAGLGQLLLGVRTARYIGFPTRTAFSLPLGYAFYAAIFAGSVVDHYLGGNTWAGRRIAKPERLAHASRGER